MQQRQSALGGLLDIIYDFTIYSILPISIALAAPAGSAAEKRLAVAVLLATFHVNNVLLVKIHPIRGFHNVLTSLSSTLLL